MARFGNLKLASVRRRGANTKIKAIKVKKLHLVRIRISVEFLGEFVNRFFPPFEFFPMISLLLKARRLAVAVGDDQKLYLVG